MPGAPLLVMFWDSSAEGAARISIRERPDEVWQTAGMRYDGTTSIATFGVPLEESKLKSTGNRRAGRLPGNFFVASSTFAARESSS